MYHIVIVFITTGGSRWGWGSNKRAVTSTREKKPSLKTILFPNPGSDDSPRLSWRCALSCRGPRCYHYLSVISQSLVRPVNRGKSIVTQTDSNRMTNEWTLKSFPLLLSSAFSFFLSFIHLSTLAGGSYTVQKQRAMFTLTIRFWTKRLSRPNGISFDLSE